MYVVVVMPKKQSRASSRDMAVVYSSTYRQMYGFLCWFCLGDVAFLACGGIVHVCSCLFSLLCSCLFSVLCVPVCFLCCVFLFVFHFAYSCLDEFSDLT